ncbi:hypothetical protein EXIGLDRAFT_844635 [Exidia glandulosa HHB12029]|uniref:F-box domain-containing protein n=1 Tax=Exidia glandulosa HHB12029 TaxID=1314781 RepID=A0A165ZC60_EXIGL|nr:hypothetical protein EXIGLDRAFT_844635 [Exidia glandulosa HHB12029]
MRGPALPLIYGLVYNNCPSPAFVVIMTLNALPTELLVLTAAALSLPNLIRVTHVSRRLRQALRAAPMLWVELRFHTSRFSCEAMSALLALSRDLPVRVLVSSQGTACAVKPHMSRVKELLLCYPEESCGLTATPAPLLEFLYVQTESPVHELLELDVPLFGGDAPMLHTAHFRNILLLPPALPPKRVKRLLHDSDLQSLHGGLFFLRSLTVDCDDVWVPSDGGAQMTFTVPYLLELLPLLNTFVLRNGPPALSSSLIRSLPPLRGLMLDDDDGEAHIRAITKDGIVLAFTRCNFLDLLDTAMNTFDAVKDLVIGNDALEHIPRGSQSNARLRNADFFLRLLARAPEVSAVILVLAPAPPPHFSRNPNYIDPCRRPSTILNTLNLPLREELELCVTSPPGQQSQRPYYQELTRFIRDLDVDAQVDPYALISMWGVGLRGYTGFFAPRVAFWSEPYATEVQMCLY